MSGDPGPIQGGVLRPIPAWRRYPSDMAVARQNQTDQSVNAGRLARADLAPAGLSIYCAADHTSRNCRFITLPLALRGSGSEVSSIVSGTL